MGGVRSAPPREDRGLRLPGCLAEEDILQDQEEEKGETNMEVGE